MIIYNIDLCLIHDDHMCIFAMCMCINWLDSDNVRSASGKSAHNKQREDVESGFHNTFSFIYVVADFATARRQSASRTKYCTPP